MPRAKLLKLLVVLFVVVTALSWAISSVFSKYNSKNSNNIRKETVSEGAMEESFEGIVTFVDPRLSPDGKISFSLNDPLGNEIILLESEDQKLELSEGFKVTVYGTKKKAPDGRDYLLVERIVLKNGTN